MITRNIVRGVSALAVAGALVGLSATAANAATPVEPTAQTTSTTSAVAPAPMECLATMSVRVQNNSNYAFNNTYANVGGSWTTPPAQTIAPHSQLDYGHCGQYGTDATTEWKTSNDTGVTLLYIYSPVNEVFVPDAHVEQNGPTPGPAVTCHISVGQAGMRETMIVTIDNA